MKARRWMALCFVTALASFVGNGATMAADPADNDKAAAAAVERGNFAEAIRLLDEALATPGLAADERAELTLRRAFVHDENGEFDRAIADYGSVLTMKPDAAQAYFRRGIVHREKGEYEQALADFDAASRLGMPEAADWPLIYGDRAVVHFAMGRYGEAAADFSQVVASDPADEYAVLWLHVARFHAGKADQAELAGDAAKAEGEDWPKPLLDLYLGRKTPEQVHAAAAEGDDDTRQFQGCEADFFQGEYELQQGRKDKAKPLFQKVLNECSPSLAVHSGAAGELRRIGE